MQAVLVEWEEGDSLEGERRKTDHFARDTNHSRYQTNKGKRRRRRRRREEAERFVALEGRKGRIN